jgi:ribosomal-protein-alanine N-acetyltransferase
MNHLGTKELETKRLLLRRFTINDSELMYKNWTNDDDVTHFLSWPTHQDVNDTKNILEKWITNYSENDFYQWVIILKDINEPIGTIGVIYKNEDFKMITVGYCIGKRWWNKGIMTETLNEIIKFFFEKVKANRVEAWHDPNNQNSGKVMVKCGMKYEGHLRQAYKNNTGICDSIVYGIIAEDYFKN